MLNGSEIQVVKFTKFYHVPVHCPYCGAVPTRNVAEGGFPDPCPHTPFLAHSEGWMFISDRFTAQLEDAGLNVEREADYVAVSSPDDEDFDSVEDICLKAKFADAIMFKLIVGPPSLEASYTAFAGVEED